MLITDIRCVLTELINLSGKLHFPFVLGCETYNKLHHFWHSFAILWPSNTRHALIDWQIRMITYSYIFYCNSHTVLVIYLEFKLNFLINGKHHLLWVITGTKFFQYQSEIRLTGATFLKQSHKIEKYAKISEKRQTKGSGRLRGQLKYRWEYPAQFHLTLPVR